MKNFTGDIADTVAVKMWLLEDHSNFYENGMQALVQWWRKCVQSGVEYVEK